MEHEYTRGYSEGYLGLMPVTSGAPREDSAYMDGWFDGREAYAVDRGK
jgi:hypothetical protein